MSSWVDAAYTKNAMGRTRGHAVMGRRLRKQGDVVVVTTVMFILEMSPFEDNATDTKHFAEEVFNRLEDIYSEPDVYINVRRHIDLDKVAVVMRCASSGDTIHASTASSAVIECAVGEFDAEHVALQLFHDEDAFDTACDDFVAGYERYVQIAEADDVGEAEHGRESEGDDDEPIAPSNKRGRLMDAK
jgi:hypothetical protein